MLNRSLWMQGNSIVRVLDEKENMVLVIDCAHLSMPRWETLHILQQYHQMDEADWKREGCSAKSVDELSHQAKQIMHERFTMNMPRKPPTITPAAASRTLSWFCANSAT